MKKFILLVFLPFLLFAACSEPSLKTVAFADLTTDLTAGTTYDTISLSWTTDTATDCTVSYGPYTFYGLSTPATTDVDRLNHSAELTGLRPHTNYHFKITATPESSDYRVSETGDHEETTTPDNPNASNVSDDTWDAVGALCFSDAVGFYGPFCTGVLIAEDVVLTAAHCLLVDEDYYGRVPSASNVVFYLGGNDATPTNGGAEPAAGTIHRVDEISVHPDYDAGTLANDLALVHLTESVSGAITTPIGINTTNLSGSTGEDFTVVGFDASYSGMKKINYPTIDTLFSDSFNDDENNQNLGSAGIPAFMEIGGVRKVIGISSSVTEEPFTGPAVYTMVDAYSSWIGEVISEFNSP